MPAPQFLTTGFGQDKRQIIKFGNYNVPIIGGTQPWVDLNDGVSWFAQDLIPSVDHQLFGRQQAWRAKAVWQSEDFGMLKFSVPTIFDEGGGQTFMAARAALFAVGEQYLTFDNATQVLAKCKEVKAPKILGGIPPLRFATELEFWCKEPWLSDVAQTTSLANPVSGAVSGGSLTSIVAPVAGSAPWVEPVYVLNVPVGNGNAINTVQIVNRQSGESLTVNLVPALPAATAKTLTIDCAALTAVDESNIAYDFTGSFPMLYPGAAQILDVTIVSGGPLTGVTLDIKFTARWVV